MTARCAHHPQLPAVDTCTRCGAFVCGDCADVGPDDATVCTTCLPKLAPKADPRRATWALGLSLASLAWLLVGPVLQRGVAGEFALVMALAMAARVMLVAALVAVVLSAPHLRRGGWRARVALVCGALALAVHTAREVLVLRALMALIH